MTPPNIISWLGKKLPNQLGINFTEEHELLKGVSRIRSLDIILELGKKSSYTNEKDIAFKKLAELYDYFVHNRDGLIPYKLRSDIDILYGAEGIEYKNLGLGKEHKFYQFPKYLKQNFEEKQMMPDVVSSFSMDKIAPVTDKTLLSQMIYYGKELYLKDLLLPDYADVDKMGYTPEQIKWCEENESYMWRYFLEKEMLYSNDSKLGNRFVNPAPFSKFYLEIDNKSPGKSDCTGWDGKLFVLS